MWHPIDSPDNPPPKTSDDFTSGAIEILGWIPNPEARNGGDREVIWWEPKINGGCWFFSGDFPVKPSHYALLLPPPSPPGKPANG